MHAHQQEGRLAAAYLRGSRIALWASMFLAVPLIIFSHDLFALYLGGKYADHMDAANVMIILLLGFPFTYPSLMYYRIAHAKGEFQRIAILSIVSQIGNLALTLVLIGPFRMGSVGSAVATLASFAIAWPLGFWPAALRTLKISWRRFVTHSLLPGLWPAVVSAAAGWLAATLIGDSTVVRVTVGVPLCLVVYAVVMGLSFQPADRADFLRLLRAVRSKGSDTLSRAENPQATVANGNGYAD
jgi:O-antigen/teichoic acid export membrane protein